ncbi:MAG: MFS transporter [Acidobacteriaceae bacterium]|nr:MFS transporter [Acidobacteriaceae bacterium]
MTRPASSPPSAAEMRVAGLLFPTTALVFVAYLAVGLEAAAVPSFVHGTLGYSTTLAGLTVSAQFIATLLNRASAGRVTDTLGPQRTVSRGLLLIVFSAVLFALATLAPLQHRSLALWGILISRLLLGWGVSWVSTAGTVWGIQRTGAAHNAQVVAWSGVASYGSLALGAPIGLWMATHPNMPSLGLCIGLLCLAGAVLTYRLPAVAVPPGEALHLFGVVRRVVPYGIALALAASGFGVFSSFITLFFQSQHWPHSALPLSLYGIVFVAVRLVLARYVDRSGPFPIALASLPVEIAGLLILALAHTPLAAFAAACMIGAGFSLVFPALCVQTLQSVEPRDRASAVSVYTAFIELSLASTAPLAGAIIARQGFRTAFSLAAALALLSLAGVIILAAQNRGGTPTESVHG